MGNFYTIPVPLIKRLFINTDAYNELLHAGCYLSAKRVSSYEDTDVIRHLAYCWFRAREELTPSLVTYIESSFDEELLEDDNYLFNSDGSLNDEEAYFVNDEFFEGVENQEEPFTPLGMLANGCRLDPDLWEKVKEWHDIYVFDKECKLYIRGSTIEETIRIGKSLPDFGQNYPYALVNPSFLIDYRKKNRTERARAEMAMLLAINSITGKQEWAGTTRGFIIARMFGAKKVDEIEQALQGRTDKETKLLQEAYEKYTTRRMFDSMRDKLMARGLVKCWVPYAKRVFVSPSKRFEEIEEDVLMFIKHKSPKQQIKNDTERLLKLLSDE